MSTTIDDLKSRGNGSLAPIAHVEPITPGFGTLASFEFSQRVAKCLASSTLVPSEYQNNIGNCMIALNMSQRLGADPLMVMQNLYVIHGRPSWSAQFLIATFNQCGRFSSIRYEWNGSKGNPDWACRAFATEKSTGERIESAWIDWKMVVSEGWIDRKGSKWRTMPELMFQYRAAAWLVRAHAPELSMGLQTAEELHDVFDAERTESGTWDATPNAETVEAEADVKTPSAPLEVMEAWKNSVGELETLSDLGRLARDIRADKSLSEQQRMELIELARARQSELKQQREHNHENDEDQT